MTVICHFGAQKIGLVENRFGVPIKVFFNLHPQKIDMESENDGFQKDY